MNTTNLPEPGYSLGYSLSLNNQDPTDPYRFDLVAPDGDVVAHNITFDGAVALCERAALDALVPDDDAR